jgi:hypothetical protein
MSRWFTVRCIFKATDRPAYEERITLWHADSIDSAIQMAEDEANHYSQGSGFQHVGLAQAYDTGIDALENASEVFSLIRKSSLSPTEYIDRFFDTGKEVQKTS